MIRGKIKVRLTKSTAGQLKNVQASVRGLGLRRIGHVVEVIDTPQNRGMINAARHMLAVEKA
jgi:large subunit ribosomal protein L30